MMASENIFAIPEGKNLHVVSFFAFLVAVDIFFRCMPFYVWSVTGTVSSVCAILLPLLALPFLQKINTKNGPYILVFATSLFISALAVISAPLSFINRILLLFIPLMQPYFLKKAFEAFKTIFCVFLILGLIEYVLVLTNVVSPTGIIPPLNDLKLCNYYTYHFVVKSTDLFDAIIPRFYGVFDEPGVIGTICALLLYCSGGKLKSWKDYVLILAGFASFSMFFFILIVFLPFLHSSTKKRILAIIIITFVFVLITRVPFLYDIIGYRFLFDSSSGTFAGDTRYNENTQGIIFSDIFSHDFWWGHGRDAVEQFEGQSSALIYGYSVGFAFVILNVTAYIIMGLKLIFPINKVSFLIFCIIVMGTFYQRPGFINPEYIFLMTMLSYGMAFMEQKNEPEETV